MSGEKNKGDIGRKVGAFLTWPMLRDVVLVLVLVVLGWKLVNSTISVNLQEFRFSDFLSVLLAFFAIALAAAFYFKATETSNRFYDNVYQFTKDTSEMLGRIEAGFGERLKHLDEGYTGLQQRFDQMPFDLNKAKSEAEKEEKEVKEKEQAKQKLLEDLAKKAQLADGEKKRMFADIKERDIELEVARKELQKLRRRIDEAEAFEDVPEPFGRHVGRHLPRLAYPAWLHISPSALNKQFQSMKRDIHLEAIRGMTHHGLLDEDGDLTPRGVTFLRRLIRKQT